MLLKYGGEVCAERAAARLEDSRPFQGSGWGSREWYLVGQAAAPAALKGKYPYALGSGATKRLYSGTGVYNAVARVPLRGGKGRYLGRGGEIFCVMGRGECRASGGAPRR